MRGQASPYQLVRIAAMALLSRYGYAGFASALLVVLLAVNIVKDPSLLRLSGMLGSWSTLAPLAVLAIAVTPSVLSGHGGIDLSLSTFAGFCTVLIGTFLNQGTLGHPYVVVPTILVLGLILGLVNGLLVTVVRLQPIMATLGTYLIVTGLAEHFAPGSGGMVPGWVTSISGSVVDVLIVAAVVAAWIIMQRTQFFTWLLAVGRDDRTAYASGVPVTEVRMVAYVLGGLIAGVAGLLMTALISGADSTIGPSYTLTSVAAVALGGTSLAGGTGGILGSFVGALDIFFIENLLTLANVSVFALNLAYGAILVTAVVANAIVARRAALLRTTSEVTRQPTAATSIGSHGG
jgi:ribose transport system permease protein